MHYISHLNLQCSKPQCALPSYANPWKKPLLASKNLPPLPLEAKHHFSHGWLAPCELTPIF